MRAYQAVKEEGLPVYRAAREYAVPLTTLRDRVNIGCLLTALSQVPRNYCPS